MKTYNRNKKFPFQEILLFLVILILALVYFRYSWERINNEQSEDALQISRSIVALLPMEELKSLEAKPQDIDNPHYQVVKNALKAVIHVNKRARFAYILKERNGKLYFYADSEPELSDEISPPGQEFTEADKEDYLPFKDGKELVTTTLTDRWGTWKTVYIPIKDELTGKTIAVFGMDIDAKMWNNMLLMDVIKSSLLAILLLLAVFILFMLRRKNSFLRSEIIGRKKVEEALHVSENQKVAILKAIPDMLFVFNDKGDYLEIFSEDNSKLLIDKKSAIGKNISELFPDDIATKALEAFKKSIQNKELVKFSYSLKIDDNIEFFEARVVPAGENNVLAIVRDITDLKQSEEALNKQTEELKKFNSYFVNREHKMISLKKEINELLVKQGGEEKYNIFD
jgi:PAS domain S-box-containing protein